MSLADFSARQALSVAEAHDLISIALEPVPGIQRVDLRSALSRVLAEHQLSPVDLPAEHRAAMDGIAVRAADLAAQGPTVLRIVGQVLAGRPFVASAAADGPIAQAAGDAVRITTGAVLPDGYDTVVVSEAIRFDGDLVHVDAAQPARAHCRWRASDMQRGAVAMPAGRRLGPADLALLASLGIAEVPVRRPLRVACFSTGDEIRPLGARLEQGQVYDSNRYALLAMLQRLSVDLIDMGIVPDDPIALEATLRSASERADVIITSGGVSSGEADFTREVMSRLGEVLFWQLAMRPGKPLAFGRVGQAAFFGLPGNPVAAMTCFYFFVRPALYRLQGAAFEEPPTYRARSLDSFRKRVGRVEFLRGIYYRDETGAMVVRSAGDQGSSQLIAMAQANCFVVLSEASGPIEIGDWVDVQPFDSLL